MTLKVMRYIKEYDSLRFFAVLLVIISHGFPNTAWLHKIPLGMIGVSFFFVLSGKLITSILLQERDNENNNVWQKLKVFYIRRSLRIFPAYYLFLLLNLYLNNPELKQHFLYFIFYLQNILFFKTVQYAGALSPTWTLAVEEQFYLLWPFFILLIKPKYLKSLILISILISPIFRVVVTVVCKAFNQSSGLNLALMPSNLICLAGGGLLAFFEYKKHYIIQKLLDIKIPLASIIIFIPAIIIIKNQFAESILYQIIITILSIWLLNYIANSSNHKSFVFLKNRVTTYLGRISYGLYLYHTVALTLIVRIFSNKLIFTISSDLGNFFVEMIALVLFSSVSWFCFEKPINSLKKHFKY